ncbi:D111/G-patch domain-containing protein [Striga asiatica]|uniref:D111/G-patch domain-containing protein n=1 Tax=Striga asiatica TaxID=4170 RepID=A0A5A7P1W1_STRAF|nr:D111/G-patch domain-containing protein [Striga asiatica]
MKSKNGGSLLDYQGNGDNGGCHYGRQRPTLNFNVTPKLPSSLKLDNIDKQVDVMEAQNRPIAGGDGDPTIGPNLQMVSEEVQDPNPTRHLHHRLNLQTRPDPEPAEPIRYARDDAFGPGGGWSDAAGEGEWLDGECGGHVAGPAGVDFSGGYEHEADLGAGVEEAEGAVVVGEGGAVGVGEGGVLGEGEPDGGVGGGEGRDLDGVDGEDGGLGLEYGEEGDEGDNDDEDEEDGGDYARGEVGPAGGRRLVDES